MSHFCSFSLVWYANDLMTRMQFCNQVFTYSEVHNVFYSFWNPYGRAMIQVGNKRFFCFFYQSNFSNNANMFNRRKQKKNPRTTKKSYTFSLCFFLQIRAVAETVCVVLCSRTSMFSTFCLWPIFDIWLLYTW